MNVDFNKILNEGVSITSSGTTGIPKTIHRTPSNLKACIDVAINGQSLTPESKVLTVTRMTHAGGLLLQSLPAFTLGCELTIQAFNAFTFLKDFKNYTHTFLPPAMMTAVMSTKEFKQCDLSGKFIVGGSDPVSWEMIEAFVERGAILQTNWGMSEIGPCVINTTFTSLEQVHAYKKTSIEGLALLGDTFYCDTKIVNGILHVKGDICVFDGWFNTGDRVVVTTDNHYYYAGRN
jgi:acyl-CoA synthetase (AMP-forming)/AMP-acid ligase II